MNTPKPFFSCLRFRTVIAALRRRPSCLVLPSVFLAAVNFARAEPLLAYSCNGTIYTAHAADGKEAKKICAGDDPCISNDGRFLVYTRTEQKPNQAKHRAKGDDPAPHRAVAVRELVSGKETRLPVGGSPQVYGALWSPDDVWIAFNVLTGKNWQVAVVHPDGSAFHMLTGKLDPAHGGYYLAGWNLHDKAALVENLDTMAQLDPASGEAAWQRPIRELTGEESCDSGLRGTISADGKLLVSTRFADDDEFENLDGPSSYLVLTEFPGGKPRRVTPAKFDVATPWLESTGVSVLLRGFGQRDLTPVKGGDGVKLKTRIYRYDLRSGTLTPVTKDGEYPSSSRG